MNAQPKLLILDPNIQFSRLLSKKLSDIGCRTSIENNATEALPAIERYRPDIILLEPEFKTASGFEICKEIKSNSQLRGIPILFHGRNATYQTIMESLKVGAASFIVKPSSRDTLIRKLNEVAQKLGWKEQFQTDPAQPLGFASTSVEGAPDIERPQVAFSSGMNSTAKIEALTGDAKEVKAMPFAVARTLEVTQDDRSGAQELGSVIESDTALMTKVLARANSVAYGGQKAIGSVKDAIVRLGFRQTRELVLSISIIRNFNAETHSLGFQRGAFWEHSLAVGMIARALAEQSQVADPDMAFVSGLVHDLGKLIFDEYMSSDYESAIEIAGSKKCSLRDAEDQTFIINHTDVGAALLTKWRFPDIMVKAAALHHSSKMIPKIAATDIRSMVGLIHVANAMAKARQWGNSGDDLIYPISDDLMHCLNLAQGLPANFFDSMTDKLAGFRKFLGIPPSDDASTQKQDLNGHVVVSIQEPSPILDTHGILLSRDWGFEHRPVESVEELDGVDGLDQAVVIMTTSNTTSDRDKYVSLLSDRKIRGAILLLDHRSQDAQTDQVEWPTDQFTMMETPISGHALLSVITQLCHP